jgi:antitoxin ParD1/3/4
MAQRSVVELPNDLAERLNDRVASGASLDAVEAIREGLAALEAEDARRLSAIRERIEKALADPRPSVPADDAFAKAEELVRSIARK